MIENRKLKPGTRLVARHKARDYEAVVVVGEGGKLRYRLKDGREFKTPSGAGSAVMGGVACNGWRFWSVAAPAQAAKTSRKKARLHPKRGRNAKRVVVARASGGSGKQTRAVGQ